MLYQILLIISAAAGGGNSDSAGASQAQAQGAAAPTMQFEAEDQTPSGKFLTAGEVRPILDLTKNNWIHVREFDGQDLLYVTHLLSWRCGLHQIEWRVNQEDWQVWQMPQCYVDEPAPAAIKPGDPEPYVRRDLGSIETVSIRLLYDDLEQTEVTFGRNGQALQ